MHRSNRRKFKRRRQRAGFVLFACLVLIVLSGLLFMNTGSEQETAAVKVQRLDMPDVGNAPDAVEAKEDAGEEEEAATETSAEDERAREEKAQEKKDEGSGDSGSPSIPEPASVDLYLTVPKMGLTDNYVANTDDPVAMDNGAIKLPSTGFPWQPNANTYIAAHVLGYSGTGSYMQFAGLPSMTYGDEIYLTDANGTVYAYAVTEILTVTPQDNWVTEPIAGKDMVTLQTCVNPPYYDQRLVVRAERVDVQVA
jgi:sortase A